MTACTSVTKGCKTVPLYAVARAVSFYLSWARSDLFESVGSKT